MLALAAAVLAITMQVQDGAASLVPQDSYADTATATLVNAARGARDRNERLVTAYRARVSQRLGVGLHALSRDRMLYRQELVADISWRRDSTSTMTVVGAREGVPVATGGDQVPSDLDDMLSDLILDPASDYLQFLGPDGDNSSFIYPLSLAGESLYRFKKGSTTSIGLPNGRQVRLVALEVTARRADYRLVNGTFWFDEATYNLVRAVFRPSRPFEMRRDVDPDDLKGVPGFVNARAEAKYITLEYALFEGRWWMPRYVGIDAVGSVGSWLNSPFRLERVYSNYEVEGGTPPDSTSMFRPAGSSRVREGRDSVERQRLTDSLRVAVTACIDSATADDNAGERVTEAVSGGVQARRCRARVRNDRRNLTVVVPTDSAALLTSPTLGPPILAMGDLVTEGELLTLRGAIDGLPGRPWEFSPQLPHGMSALLEHARYNRVEGLSLGLGSRIDLGKLQLRGVARIGLADGRPRGELSLDQIRTSTRLTFSGYSRLAVANPENNPLGAINSFMSLVAGRDDGEYFRSHGAEVVAENTVSRWWSARVWTERQQTALVETSASLPHLFSSDRRFRANFLADDATQYGASLALRGSTLLSRHVTLGVQSELRGETGDFDFGRGSLTALALLEPGGPLAGALTLSAGTTRGTVPTQGQFFLGGSGTLRGYAGGAMRGDAYWTARAEVGNAMRAARLIAFTDAGWAGPRGEFGSGRPLIGAGVGISFLDGLVRIDLARALKNPTGWRLEFYVDGLL